MQRKFISIITYHFSYNKYMRKNKIVYVIGYIVVTILGTLLHFVYEWSNRNRIVGLFSAVNESTWEHMKLAFFPMLLFSLVFMSMYANEMKPGKSLSLSSVAANLAESTLLATWFIPVMFYTYSGILGENNRGFDTLYIPEEMNK